MIEAGNDSRDRTPPDPGRKSRASEMDQKQKPGGRPVKKDHPEEGR